MKRSTFLSSRRASALLAVLIFSLIISITLVGFLMNGIDRKYNSLRVLLYDTELNAAESVLDSVVAQIAFMGTNRPAQISRTANGMVAFVDSLGDDNEPFFQVPQVPGFITDAVVERMSDPAEQPITITQAEVDRIGPEMQQWLGYPLTLDEYVIYVGAIASEAPEGDDDSAGTLNSAIGKLKRPGVYLSKRVTFYQVPLLNYAIFYENNLEIDAGARIDVFGPVHTNKNWFLTTSSEAWYHSRVTVAGDFIGGMYHYNDRARGQSKSENINIATEAPATPGSPVATNKFQKVKRAISEIAINNGWLSRWNYNNAWYSGSNNSGLVWNADKGEWFPSEWTPNPNWVDDSERIFKGMVKDSAHGVKYKQLPLAGDNARELIAAADPTNDPDNAVYMDNKFEWLAAIVVEPKSTWPPATTASSPPTSFNDPSYFNIYQWVPDGSGGMKKEYFSHTYRLSGQTTTKSFLSTGRFYNGREQAYIYTVDVDIALLTEFLKSGAAQSVTTPTGTTNKKPNLRNPRFKSDGVTPVDDGIIYVKPKTTEAQMRPKTTSNPNGITGVVWASGDSANGPAMAGVRIKNGKDMTSLLANSGVEQGTNGLTFATNAPLYTWGDINAKDANINTSGAPGGGNSRIPLLLAGDSMNILSTSFNNTNYWKSSGTGPNNASGSTVTNAVFLAGNVPSDKYARKNPDGTPMYPEYWASTSSTMPSFYSGGAENYFRYLENWGGKKHKYVGSVLNLYESQVQRAPWDNNAGDGHSSGYYGAPQRDWAWDPTFASGKTPPGIPRLYDFTQSDWSQIGKEDFKDEGGVDLEEALAAKLHSS